MAPHITAELWARRHDGEHVHERRWPVADPAMTTVESVTMIVQVNGKVRAKLEVAPDISEAEATRVAVDTIQATATIEPVRVIAKPPKLVNIVT
jgi:leucyl-tRNA synthetase